MDTALFIFGSFMFVLVAGSVYGVFLFRRKPKRRKQTASKSERDAVEALPLTALEQEAALLQEMVAAIDDAAAGTGGVSLFRARLGALPTEAPRSAIMKSWRELEDATLQTLALYDYGDQPVKRLRSIEIMALLRDNGVHDEGSFAICRQMEDIRQAVFGKTDREIGRRVAPAVVDAAEILIRQLENFRRQVASGAAPPELAPRAGGKIRRGQ